MTNEEAWVDLCEKSDRTSPDGYPDMALISQAELYDYLDTVRAEGSAERAKFEVAARAVLEEADRRLTMREPPWKYGAAYGQLTKLREALDALAQSAERGATEPRRTGNEKREFDPEVVRLAMPMYGRVNWEAIIAAVGEAQGCQWRKTHEEGHVGHEMVGCNMNSLNRVVSAFLNAAGAKP